jgi:hypothetical protein
MLLQDFIKDKIELLPTEVVIDFVENDILYVCNSFWLRVGDEVIDSLMDSRKIVEIEKNFIRLDSIGFDDSTIKTIPLRKIHFFWGTPIQTNQEYISINKYSREKTPFIWLFEPWKEVMKEGSAFVNYDEIVFYILDCTNEPSWINEEQKKYALSPMKALGESFFDVLKKNPYGLVVRDGYKMRQKTRFGVMDKNGAKKKIIDEDLSGWELELKNPKMLNKNCNC